MDKGDKNRTTVDLKEELSSAELEQFRVSARKMGHSPSEHASHILFEYLNADDRPANKPQKTKKGNSDERRK